MYLGQIRLDDNLTFAVNTHTPATGAAVAADAVPGYRLYEDETAVPILTGNMAALDDANTTGYYSEQIAVTAANGFEAGKSYTVRITGVVAGVTGVEIHTFTVTAHDLDDIEAQTDDIGVAGAGLTALPAMVWASATRTLTSFGTLLADIWAYATRTLTASSGVTFPAGAIEYTYTVTDSGTGLPIEGVSVRFSTDAAGVNIIWAGITDAFGVARDVLDSKPWLDAGTYYVGRKKAGYTFGPDADVEVVSA